MLVVRFRHSRYANCVYCVSVQFCLVFVLLMLDTAGWFVIGVAESPVDMRSTLDRGASHAVDIYWALSAFVVL